VIVRRRSFVVLLVLIIFAAACTSAATPVPVPVAAISDTATPAATLRSTETIPPSLTPTETVSPSLTPTATPTTKPRDTPTATPTSTSRPSPTAAATRTKKPTQPPTQEPATATPPLTSAAIIPAPVIRPFNPDLFIRTIDNAHAYFIKYLEYHGKVSSGNISVGSCFKFYNIRSDWTSLLVFSDVPEAWAPLHTEYRALRDQVFIVTDPINQICGGGRGSISPETDRQILDFLDRGQNRLYEIGQQARAMK
jgi:hypothetical protein